MTINRTISVLLEIYGWTPYALAKKAGISQSTLSNLQHRCNSPSLNTLEAVTSGFGLTLSDFFFFKETCESLIDPEPFISYMKSLPEQECIRVLRFIHYGIGPP